MPQTLRGALRLARWLACAAVLQWLAGCGTLIPQTVALRTDWPQGVPRQVELARVPFYPQDDYLCGPAALAMAMNHGGAGVRPEALVDEVWLPSRRGSLQLEMLAAPRRHGLVGYRLEPRYADLLREVAAGNPVIVLQDAGLLFPQWHYAVVNGFDYATGTVYLRSGRQPRQAMPFSYFERTWRAGSYWAMVVLPPERIAATASEDRWLEAVNALARSDGAAGVRAYRAALARWPDSLPAVVGLANQLHDEGVLDEAAAVLRAALQRNPASVILQNNLAQTLSDQGRNDEALAWIRRAEAAHSPFASEVRATRKLIEERLLGSPNPAPAPPG